MANTLRLTTDILIIGGGSAGCMAAIRAKEVAPELAVTIFEKGDIRRGGTLAMGMDALNVVVIPGVTSEDDYLAAVHLLAEGIYDAAPHRVVARRSLPVVRKLESWGVRFGHNEDGSYVLHQIHPNAPFTVPMHAPDLKVLLAGKVRELGVRVINRTMAVSLLADGDGVGGAIGLDVRSGDLTVCAAKAVILAGAGAARFGLPNSGYLFGTLDFPGNAGDTYALAFRASAKLTNAEVDCPARRRPRTLALPRGRLHSRLRRAVGDRGRGPQREPLGTQALPDGLSRPRRRAVAQARGAGAICGQLDCSRARAGEMAGRGVSK